MPLLRDGAARSSAVSADRCISFQNKKEKKKDNASMKLKLNNSNKAPARMSKFVKVEDGEVEDMAPCRYCH